MTTETVCNRNSQETVQAQRADVHRDAVSQGKELATRDFRDCVGSTGRAVATDIQDRPAYGMDKDTGSPRGWEGIHTFCSQELQV